MQLQCQIIANPFRHDLPLINLIDDKTGNQITHNRSTIINRKLIINLRFKKN